MIFVQLQTDLHFMLQCRDRLYYYFSPRGQTVKLSESSQRINEKFSDDLSWTQILLQSDICEPISPESLFKKYISLSSQVTKIQTCFTLQVCKFYCIILLVRGRHHSVKNTPYKKYRTTCTPHLTGALQTSHHTPTGYNGLHGSSRSGAAVQWEVLAHNLVHYWDWGQGPQQTQVGTEMGHTQNVPTKLDSQNSPKIGTH